MDENVLIAACRFDEAIALGRIEPLDGALLHRLPSSLPMSLNTPNNSHYTPRVVTAICATSRIWENSETIVAHDSTRRMAQIRLQLKEARQIRRKHDCKISRRCSNSRLRFFAQLQAKQRENFCVRGNQKSTMQNRLRIVRQKLGAVHNFFFGDLRARMGQAKLPPQASDRNHQQYA